MKKIVILLSMLVLCFAALCGCAKLKNDTSTYFVREHIEPDNTRNSVVKGIDSYDRLRESLEDIISKVQTDVSLVVVNYEGDLRSDLDSLSYYLTHEYPLGTYGVASIKFNTSFIASYCEVETKITYSRPYDEISGVMQVISPDEVDDMLCSMIKTRDLHRAFSFSGFNVGQEYIEECFYKAWLQSYCHAYGIKDVSFTWFPSAESGSCIVDVKISLTDSILDIEEKVKQTQKAAATIASDCASVKAEDKVRFVLNWLKENVYFDRYAGEVFDDVGWSIPKTDNYTASGALLNGSAANSGITLAASVLLDELGIKNRVIKGRIYDRDHMWICISIDGESYFVDPSGIYHKSYDSCFTEARKATEYKWDPKIYSLE